MKKKFSFLLLAFLLAANSNAFSQIEVMIQAGPNAGKDALIQSVYPTTNFGSNEELVMSVTNNNITRSLIQFDLSSIPPNFGIEYAAITFQGYHSSVLTPQGNISPNSLWLERIIQSWGEYDVKWINQPQTEVTNRIMIPSSNQAFNWSYFVYNRNELVIMVQDMVTNINNNNGFMLKLQNETGVRNTFFVSSDYPDWKPFPEKYRPSIFVKYSIPEFDYFSNSSIPDAYTFTSIPYSSNNCSHIWIIDGIEYSTDPLFTTNLLPGIHHICHTIIYYGIQGEYTNSKCITICVNQ